MDIQRAKEVLTILADGIHPITGEILPPEDSCNHPEVIRALYIVLASLKEGKASCPSLPKNAGKPWTKEDEKTLCEMFDQGKNAKEISEFFKRTSGGIAARLVKLGKISDRSHFILH